MLLYMVTWIPSIYPLYVSIYTIHICLYGSYGHDEVTAAVANGRQVELLLKDGTLSEGKGQTSKL